MSHASKRQYLFAIIERYQKSNKYQKGVILDEFCAICGYHRNYAVRLLNASFDLPRPKSGRKRKYTDEVVRHLIILWHAMGQICSKRMKKAMAEWLSYYEAADMNEELATKLKSMSHSTIDHYLQPERKKRGISTTRPSKYWFKSRIPIQAEDMAITEPGFVTADTVAHCGESAAGSFVNTLTVTDIGSTWTVNQALWTKTQHHVKGAMEEIEARLPFSIGSFKSDSGNEFLNQVLFSYFVDRKSPVQFYRTRPYQKNDNCHVEQKNFTHVRTLFGYQRLDSQVLVEKMNEIYENYWNPLQNFFLPTMKLTFKERQGAKVKKLYDSCKTPFQRLIESKSLTDEQKKNLAEFKKTLNPFRLRAGLEAKLGEFRELLKLQTTGLIAA